MKGTQNLSLDEDNTTLIDIGKRLLETYIGQAVFRDWIEAEQVNVQIDLLDLRAKELTSALTSGTIDAAELASTSQQILLLMYPAAPAGQSKAGEETEQQALTRLARQYADEIQSLGGDSTLKAIAFLHGILTLEKAANLGERDRMRIYGIVTDAEKLAGAGLFAFIGFFDQVFRDHDYDWGRTIAQQLLAKPLFQAPGQLGPIRYTPAAIRPINAALSGILLKDIPKADVNTLRVGLIRRAKQIIADKYSNPLLRIPINLGASLALKALIDWEFSLNKQGIAASKSNGNDETGWGGPRIISR